MDRRSRSASRHNHYNNSGMSSLQADYGNGHYRHSTHFDTGAAPASLTLKEFSHAASWQTPLHQ